MERFFGYGIDLGTDKSFTKSWVIPWSSEYERRAGKTTDEIRFEQGGDRLAKLLLFIEESCDWQDCTKEEMEYRYAAKKALWDVIIKEFCTVMEVPYSTPGWIDIDET